jgi:hypothetical protein
MFFDRFDGILATRRGKPTSWAKHRADRDLVKPNRQNEKATEHRWIGSGNFDGILRSTFDLDSGNPDYNLGVE